MSRGNPDRCLDIIEAIGKIERYQTKLSGPDVEMAYDAIVRQLGIIDEAAKRRKASIRIRRQQHPRSNGTKSSDSGTSQFTSTSV